MYSEIVKNDDNKDFGTALRTICDNANISIHRLSMLAKMEYARLISEGRINPGANIGSLDEGNISKIMWGDKKPSPMQLLVLFDAIRNWHSSSEFAEMRKDAEDLHHTDMPTPQFTDEDELHLWRLAAYNSYR